MDGMHFPSDFTKSFVISFNYIRTCNLRFFAGDIPFRKKYWRFIVKSVIAVLQLMSMLMYLYRAFGSQASISKIAFTTASALIGLQSVLKATVLLPKTKDIEILIEGLAKTWKTENLSDFQIKERDRRLGQLNIGQTVFYWGSVIAIIQNLAPHFIHTVYGKIRQEDFNFILPFGYVYPFDPVKNWVRYLLVYVLQSCSIIHLVHYYLGAECLLVTLCCQLSTEFALLREDIQYLIPMSDRNRMPEEFTVDNNMTIEAMIKNHQELIKYYDLLRYNFAFVLLLCVTVKRLAQALNHIFNRMVFVDLWFFAMILCFFAVVLSISHDAIDKFTNIVSIFCLLILVFLFCYYCEMLKEESTGIADSAYENPWYEGEIRYQKTIQFIIMRAQLPCYVTSINYVPITLNTFTTVVSTTWSYFTLMTTLYGDN